MEKVLERSEVKKEDTWDVESIYGSIKDWQEDYEDCRKYIWKYKRLARRL